MAAMERVAFELQYSGAGGAFCLGGVVLVSAVAFALPLSAPMRVAFIAWAAAQGCFAAARLAAVAALEVRHTGEVRVLDRHGVQREGLLRPGSFVRPWLVAVRWRPAGSRRDRTVLLWPGRAPPQALRRLRVLLRWSSPPRL